MLEHQPPDELLLEACRSDRTTARDLRATSREVGFLLLQSPSESDLQEALKTELGLELPPPQESRVLNDYALLWLTPAEWLLEIPRREAHSFQSALAGRLASSLTAVTDMSDAIVGYELSGTRAAEFLMSGCSLDLNVREFPTGRVARTVLADIPAIIWNPGLPDRFRCLIDRSFAVHFGDWLADATRS